MKKMINSYKKWNPSVYATVLILSMSLMVYLFSDFMVNNDFWFLANTGKTILNEGFIRIESFTIHTGLDFIPQQWLTDVIFWLIYQKFSNYGMFCFLIICEIPIIYLIYKNSYLVSNSKKISILVSTITNAFLIAIGIITTRPQLFDIIILLLELFLLESYVIKNNKKYLYFIPLLFIFLINAHASTWMMLFVFMIPYFVESVINKKKKKDTFKIKPLLIIMFISLLVGLINPYGIDAIKYLFNSYGVWQINRVVNEMKPVSMGNILGLIIYIFLFVAVISFYRNKGNNKIRYFLLFLGLTFLTMNHYRAFMYLVIVSPLFFSYNFKSNHKEIKVKVQLYEKIIYLILFLLLITVLFTQIKINNNIDIKEFADYLDEYANYDISLYTGYDDGAYMEFRGYKCYTDSRAEVFLKTNNHKEDIFNEFYKLYVGELDVKKFLNKYNFDYLLVNSLEKPLLKELQENVDYIEVLSKTIDANQKISIYLFQNISKNKTT